MQKSLLGLIFMKRIFCVDPMYVSVLRGSVMLLRYRTITFHDSEVVSFAMSTFQHRSNLVLESTRKVLLAWNDYRGRMKDLFQKLSYTQLFSNREAIFSFFLVSTEPGCVYARSVKVSNSELMFPAFSFSSIYDPRNLFDINLWHFVFIPLRHAFLTSLLR